MASHNKNRFLLFGAAFLLVGSVLLLWTLGYLEGLGALWPLIPLFIGLLFLTSGFRGLTPEASVFSGVFLSTAGLFFLLLNTVMSAIELARVWPVFMTLAGLSLLAYSRRRPPNARLSLVLPAAVIIFLSLVFFTFSFGIVQDDFIAVVALWWPVLFVFVGLVLLTIHVVERHSGVDRSKGSS